MTRHDIQKQLAEKAELPELHDIACSPLEIVDENQVSDRRLSSPIVALTPKHYDIIEVKQDLSNDEIMTMQETYQ